MCDICDKARTQPLKRALDTIATAMQQRQNRGRTCLDDFVGELVGQKSTGLDALDQETEPIKGRP